MQEYIYFEEPGTPEIHAAMVGISRKSWISAAHNDTLDDAVEKMKEHGFDILPRNNKDGSVSAYYHTTQWGKYSRDFIRWDKLTSDDSIYYLTNIKDVIRLFHEKERNFYFLTNHSTTIGLITISNLNCKHVGLYFYNLLNLLERERGSFVCSNIPTEAILHLLELIGVAKDISSALDTVKRYREDTKKGLDSAIIEYLYLSDLIILIKEARLYKQLGYRNASEFEKRTGKLKDFRNAVAHPNRSLVKDRSSLGELWQGFTKIDELEERLLKREVVQKFE